MQQRMQAQQQSQPQEVAQVPQLPIHQAFQPANVVNAQLPINQAPAYPTVVKQSPLRNSFSAQKLQMAKDLDQSINVDAPKGGYNSLAGPSPRHQQQQQISLASPQGGMLHGLGNNEADHMRRQDNKQMMQAAYKQYLAAQQKGSQATPTTAQRPPSASRQVADKDSSLLAGGLSQIGGHQYKQEEEKARRQREYRELLEMQQRKASAPQVSQSNEFRRQQLSEQVFNELLSNRQEQQVPEQLPMLNQRAPGLPPRVQSAVGANRKNEVQRLQMQSYEDPFHKNQKNENSIKRRELEQKREYAAILQKQMQEKESQKVKRPPTVPQQQNFVNPSAQQPQVNHFPKPVQQPAHLDMPAYQQHLQDNLQQQFYQPQGQMPPPQPVQMPPPASQAQFQAPQQQPIQMPPPQQQQQLIPGPSFQDPFHQPSSAPSDKQRQDEYRRQLEEQIKLKEDAKAKYQQDQQQYEKQHDMDMAAYVQGKGQQEGGSTRPRTDITRRWDQKEQEDPAKQMARQKYQAELRIQMEEQKKRKEDEERKRKAEEEEHERKMLAQRDELSKKERSEMKKEGKKDNEIPKDEVVKQVRNDQFEPSQDNHGVVGRLARAKAHIKQAQQQPKEQLFTQESAPVELPINNRREDLFAKPESQKEDLFAPTQPIQKNDLFAPSQPFQQLPPSQAPEFNMPQPHPQLAAQMPPVTTPSAFSQPSQPQPDRSQNDWMTQQSQQVNNQQAKMLEDQGRMIQLYQQALEQILQYRNQYFEQAMEMRENILKEREQLLEVEKMKQQQFMEMQQLKAVQNQLGSLAAQAPGQPALTNQVQTNLNQYISQQKEQLLQMSQSSAKMQEIIKQAQVEKQGFLQQSDQKKYELPVTSERVEVPEQIAVEFTPQENEIQKQVDEITAKVSANAVLPPPINFDAQVDFDQSLSSKSKLVKVPNSNLQDKAQQLQQNSADKSGDLLTSTWNENSLQVMANATPSKAQFDSIDSNKTPKRQKVQTIGILNSNKSPLNISSQVPQTIAELPHEEVEDKPKKQQTLESHAKQSIEFNNRETSNEGSPVASPAANQSNYEFQKPSPIDEVYRRTAQNTSAQKFAKATITGSSFYDQTMKNQKILEQNRQEEMQKQLQRIFGAEQEASSSFQNKASPKEERVSEAQKSSTQKVRISHERLDSQRPEYKLPEDSQINESEINIANTQTESQIRVAQEDAYSQQESQRPSELYSQQKQQQVVSVLQEESKLLVNSESVRSINKATFQLREDTPSVQKQSQVEEINAVSDEEPEQNDEKEQTQKDPSVWDDPELVPPPVYGYDQSYNDADNSGFQAHEVDDQSNNYGQDRTIQGLQKLVPDILSTNEFRTNDNSYRMPTAQPEEVRMPTAASRVDDQRRQFILMPDEDSQDQQQVESRIEEPIDEPVEEPVEEAVSEPVKSEIEENIVQNQEFMQAPSAVEESQMPFSKASDIEKDQAETTSQISKKEQEMMEIAALIRKATNTTNKVVEQEAERKSNLSANSKQSGLPPKVKGTPVSQNSKIQHIYSGQPKTAGNVELNAITEENETPVYQEHMATVPQQKTETKEQLPISNDQQILADLDKIISNLENQQKNMATFGIPQGTPDVLESSSEEEKQNEQIDQLLEEQKKTSFAKSNLFSQDQDEPKPPQFTPVIDDSQKGKWKSLKEAREEKVSRPVTGKSTASGRAPLDPNSRPKSNRKKSGLRPESNLSKRSGISPNQRVGKYTQMAMGHEASNTNLSQVSNSPQRVGKYAQMALQSNTSAANISKVSASPQRVGKYAQMAMGQQQSATNLSRVSASPQRVGKYAQMAMNSSRLSNKSGLSAHSGSHSPARVGKYSQMALAAQNRNEEDIDKISQKYGRNPSREDKSQVDDAVSSAPNGGLPILRPVSSKLNVDRYSATRPRSKYSGTPAQQMSEAFRQTGNMTQGTAQRTVEGKQARDPKNIAYYSDEDEDYVERLAFTGQTEQTAQNAMAHHIQHKQD